jgi:serine beta-lactamase-like protein LACTB, mitochondrial
MRRLLIALALVSVATNAAAAAIPKSKIAAIERLVKAFIATNQIPGLSIAVVVDGKTEWTKAYGFADLENSVPVTPSTLYRSASIGKTITATAAMQLVEQKKLDLDADIRDYCPAFPAKPWRVTPWNLLTHTSGIRHYGGPHDKEESFSTTHYASVADALAPFKDNPLLFEPGTKWQYSTYGFDVLGCVIEGAAKTPFLTYMRDQVWRPAHMDATRDDDPSPIVPRRAAKYTRVNGHLQNAPAVDMSNRMPAGGYLTSAVDLGRFIEALLANRLVGASSFERMTTPAKLTTGEVIPYGLGWGVETEEWHNDRYVYHGGSSPGASGFLVVMPKHRFGVVYLTNLEDLSGRTELAENIARVVLDFPPPKQ